MQTIGLRQWGMGYLHDRLQELMPFFQVADVSTTEIIAHPHCKVKSAEICSLQAFCALLLQQGLKIPRTTWSLRADLVAGPSMYLQY